MKDEIDARAAEIEAAPLIDDDLYQAADVIRRYENSPLLHDMVRMLNEKDQEGVYSTLHDLARQARKDRALETALDEFYREVA